MTLNYLKLLLVTGYTERTAEESSIAQDNPFGIRIMLKNFHPAWQLYGLHSIVMTFCLFGLLRRDDLSQAASILPVLLQNKHILHNTQSLSVVSSTIVTKVEILRWHK